MKEKINEILESISHYEWDHNQFNSQVKQLLSLIRQAETEARIQAIKSYKKALKVEARLKTNLNSKENKNA